MQLVTILGLFISFFISVSFAYASSYEERLATIRKERMGIQKRISEGQNPQLFKKYLEAFDKEEREIIKKMAAEKKKKQKQVKNTPKTVKPMTPTKAKVVPNVAMSFAPTSAQDISKKLYWERQKYLSEASQGASQASLNQRMVNINFLEMELARIENPQGKRKPSNEPSRFSYKGHFQWRTESAKNQQGVQGVQQSEQSFFRFRPYLTFSPNDNLDFNLTPQATKGFGAVDANGNSTSGSTTHTELFFFEANIDYKICDNLEFKLGRQEMSYGDHVVIGALPWANNGRSFDAAKLKFKTDLFWSDLFVSKISDNSTAALGNDDRNLFGLYNSFNLGPAAKELDLYFLHQQDNTGTQLEINMAGVRAKGGFGPVFYRTENAYQEGAGLGEDAFQMNFEVGGKFHGFKFSGEYGVAGADYRQLYPTAHKFLGFADVLGRRNVEQFAAHLIAPIVESLKLRLDYHSFSRHRKDASAFRLNGATPWGTNGDSEDIGSEVDAVLMYKAPYGLNIHFGAALFEPGQYMKDQNGGSADSTPFYYGQIIANF